MVCRGDPVCASFYQNCSSWLQRKCVFVGEKGVRKRGRRESHEEYQSMAFLSPPLPQRNFLLMTLYTKGIKQTVKA